MADDDADIRGLLAAFVSSDPAFKLVGVAADADEAIAIAGEHKPDAVIDMLQAGAMSYLVKGATREQILHALHRSIEAHSKLA